MATWPAWPMQASDGDPMAHGHRLHHASAGTTRAAGFGRERGRGGRGLTGDGRGKAAGSRRVVGIAERGEVGLGGVLLLLPSSFRR
jgi:hypothetical protein